MTTTLHADIWFHIHTYTHTHIYIYIHYTGQWHGLCGLQNQEAACACVYISFIHLYTYIYTHIQYIYLQNHEAACTRKQEASGGNRVAIRHWRQDAIIHQHIQRHGHANHGCGENMVPPEFCPQSQSLHSMYPKRGLPGKCRGACNQAR
jgi:hypothetical protein